MKKCVVLLLIACHHTPAKNSPPPAAPVLEVDVSGLSGTLVVANGAATLQILADGVHAFASPGAAGASYDVTVATQPQNEICSVAHPSGTLAAGVTSIATITCAVQQTNANTIVVTPAHPFLAAGVSQQMTATLHLAGGATSDVTASVAWSSSDASRIAISTSGLATFVKVSPMGVTLTATDATDSASGSASTLPVKVAFVTSKLGKGKLGDWPDANGQTGIAAGDAICNALGASFGGAPFAAWLSDTSTDGYCHVMSRDQATCYASAGDAGPWVRPDGFPFAGGIDDLIKHDTIYTPAKIDETGSELPAGAVTFTGTFFNGVRSTSVCAVGANPVAWTDDTGASDATAGLSDLTALGWSEGEDAEEGCIGMAHLLCLQTGAGGALPAFAQPGKIVFVTSASGDGDLRDDWPLSGGATGVAAADAICQGSAAAANFKGTFQAWLSDGTTDAIHHVTGSGPWVRPDGIPIVASLTQLTTGAMFSAINELETGAYLQTQSYWTGSNADGTSANENCTGWTVNAASGSASTNAGIYGVPNVVGNRVSVEGQGWSNRADNYCVNSKHLLCFESD